MSRTYRSEALASIHETASDLQDAEVMDKRTLRGFDELCLTSVRPMSAATFGRCGRASASVKPCSRAI